jgi:predicted PurR-regulated permease PerM
MPPSQQQQQLTALLFYTLVLLLGYLVFRIFQPFLAPIGWAGVLAVVCHPVHRRLERRLGPTRAATLSTIGVALLIILPGIALSAAFVRQAALAATQVSNAITEEQVAQAGRFWTWLQELTIGRQGLDLASLAQQAATAAATWIASQAGSMLRDVVVFIVDLFIALFALFFLFRDGATFMAGIRRILPVAEAQRERMIREARNLINATVTAGFVVASIQGCLGGVTFALLGVSASLFWGVVMGFCSFLPVGSGIVWLPMAIWLLATGHVVQGIVLLCVGFGIIGLVDNFLRPMLLSGRSQLNGLLVFVSLLGGIAVFGLLGMVLGPVVVATAVGVFEAYSQRPAPEATPSPS